MCQKDLKPSFQRTSVAFGTSMEHTLGTTDILLYEYNIKFLVICEHKITTVYIPFYGLAFIFTCFCSFTSQNYPIMSEWKHSFQKCKNKN